VYVSSNNKGEYFMPNAFTPNNDGINDCFGLKFWGNITKLDFSIYNRFGERIFYSTDPVKCWDGRYKGVLQNIGAYVYIIKAVTACDTVERKGTVFLVR
jgi:gliding motility-associated-like protein